VRIARTESARVLAKENRKRQDPGRDDRETELKVMTASQLKFAIRNIQPDAVVSSKHKHALVEMAYAISAILPDFPATQVAGATSATTTDVVM
jgi:hypothetical protein